MAPRRRKAADGTKNRDSRASSGVKNKKCNHILKAILTIDPSQEFCRARSQEFIERVLTNSHSIERTLDETEVIVFR